MSDAEILDQAIAESESLARHLYSLRKLVAENATLDSQRGNLQRSAEETKKSIDNLNAEVAGRQAELADFAQQRKALDGELARLNTSISDKRTELSALTKAVEQIQTMLKAA